MGAGGSVVRCQPSQLYAAIAKEQRDMVQYLLRQASESQADLMVSLSAQEMSEELKKALLSKHSWTSHVDKSRIDALLSTFYGSTPLHLAVLGGDVEIVRLLLRHGADCNALDGRRWSPLARAVRKDGVGIDLLECLVTSGADIDFRDDEYGLSSLYVCCKAGNSEAVSLLLDHGADVNIQNNYGRTTLHIAAEIGRPDIVLKLVERGADVLQEDGEGRTPLHSAADSRTSSILVEKGAPVNAMDKRGRTALHEAVKHDRFDIVKILLEAGGIANVHDSEDRVTTLHIAKSRAVIQLLLRSGASVHSVDRTGLTPLHRAVQNHDTDLVDIFLKSGADVDAKDLQGRVPLHMLSDKANGAHIVQLLRDAGATVNCTDSRGESPLHVACRSNNTDVIRTLLESGCNATYSKKGRTAYQSFTVGYREYLFTPAEYQWKYCAEGNLSLYLNKLSWVNLIQQYVDELDYQGPRSPRSRRRTRIIFPPDWVNQIRDACYMEAELMTTYTIGFTDVTVFRLLTEDVKTMSRHPFSSDLVESVLAAHCYIHVFPHYSTFISGRVYLIRTLLYNNKLVEDCCLCLQALLPSLNSDCIFYLTSYLSPSNLKTVLLAVRGEIPLIV